jgi:hypothetical protein
MFKLGISILLFAVSIFGFAQGKYLHIPEATVQSSNEELKIFSSDRFTIIYGVHEPSKDQKDTKQHTITCIENDSKKTSSVVIKPYSEKNPNFFGFHLKQDSFSFFEDIYDPEKGTYSLILHVFYPGRDKMVQKRLLGETGKSGSVSYRYASSEEGKFSVLAALNQDRSGQQSMSLIIFRSDLEVMNRRQYRFSDKINNSFDWTLNLNSQGELLAVFQIKGEKSPDYLGYTTVNIQEEGNDRLNFTPFYGDKTIQLTDFKVFLDDEGVVEFVGVYSQRSQKGMSNKIMFKKLIHGKERLLLDVVFDLKNGNELKLDHYLAIDNSNSVLIFNEREVNKVNTSESKTSSKNEPTKGQFGNKQNLLIYSINHEKGVIWQKKSELPSSDYILKQPKLHPQIFKNYAWSDGTKLYVYLNDLVIENQGPIIVPAEFSSRGSREALSKFRPTLMTFDLSEGKSSSIAMDMNGREQMLHVLTGMSKISDRRYLISLVQTQNNTFYPIQLFIHF